MNREDLDVAIDWAANEGWNPGKHDAECFYQTDPNGFFIGFLDNEPIAMVSAVHYGESYGFMGFYIVQPQYRNSGYGLEMWEAGLKYLGNRTIGLDSVRPELVSHKKPEFKPVCVNFRFRWVKNEQFQKDSRIVKLDEVSFNQIREYDQQVFAFDRDDFLKLWTNRPGTIALGIMGKTQLTGYGVIRECREGFKIGPLFANNREIARLIYNALTSDVDTGVPIFLDTPQANTDAMAIAQDLAMVEVFRTTRMYRGIAPDLPLDKWFGITSFELG